MTPATPLQHCRTLFTTTSASTQPVHWHQLHIIGTSRVFKQTCDDYVVSTIVYDISVGRVLDADVYFPSNPGPALELEPTPTVIAVHSLADPP